MEARTVFVKIAHFVRRTESEKQEGLNIRMGFTSEDSNSNSYANEEETDLQKQMHRRRELTIYIHNMLSF